MFVEISSLVLRRCITSEASVSSLSGELLGIRREDATSLPPQQTLPTPPSLRNQLNLLHIVKPAHEIQLVMLQCIAQPLPIKTLASSLMFLRGVMTKPRRNSEVFIGVVWKVTKKPPRLATTVCAPTRKLTSVLLRTRRGLKHPLVNMAFC